MATVAKVQLATAQCTTPFGMIMLAASEHGVTKVDWAEIIRRSEAQHVEKVYAPPQTAVEIAQAAAAQLSEYFRGERRVFDLPLDFHGTPFQEAVWNALRAIPYGETRSYGDIAETIGRDKAVRAVGQANRANPIAIVIPCHRVIGATGALTGYAGSQVHLKRVLLDLETQRA